MNTTSISFQMALMAIPCAALAYGYWAAWRRWFHLRSLAAAIPNRMPGETGETSFLRLYGDHLVRLHFMRGLAVNLGFSLTVLGLIFALSGGVEHLADSMRNIGISFGFMLAGLAIQVIENASESVLLREQSRLTLESATPAAAVSPTTPIPAVNTIGGGVPAGCWTSGGSTLGAGGTL
ncbi:MAG: hypothetical protein AB7O66_13645 [Limisphaerales bacterium]